MQSPVTSEDPHKKHLAEGEVADHDLSHSRKSYSDKRHPTKREYPAYPLLSTNLQVLTASFAHQKFHLNKFLTSRWCSSRSEASLHNNLR